MCELMSAVQSCLRTVCQDSCDVERLCQNSIFRPNVSSGGPVDNRERFKMIKSQFDVLFHKVYKCAFLQQRKVGSGNSFCASDLRQ